MFSDFTPKAVLVIFAVGRWSMGNIEEEQMKFNLNARNQGGIGEILLPPAPASFRGQRIAVVSLFTDFTPCAALVIFGRKMWG